MKTGPSKAAGEGSAAGRPFTESTLETIRRGSAQGVDATMRVTTMPVQKLGHNQAQPGLAALTVGPRTRDLLKSIKRAADMSPTFASEYLVKGWFYRGQTSILFGAANVGKSFLALDLAYAISKGRSWNGCRVRKGGVLYIATEGGSGLSNRVSALTDPEFFVLSAPLSLTGRDSQACFLVEAIAAINAGTPFDFIVIDTMARVMGKADENAASDIADLLRNVGIIQRATGAHVMIVHHSGKDSDRGARGHSALRAAVDTEIEQKRNDKTDLISALITKQRDGSTGHRFDYVLQQVKLGLDQDGDPVTTCVVEPKSRLRTTLADMTDPQRRAHGILKALIEKGGRVSVEQWRTACVLGKELSNSENLESRAKAFLRAFDQLINRGLVHVRGDMVSVTME